MNVSNKFIELLMDPKTRYIKLTDQEYEASLGREYTDLKLIMPDWSSRLHTHGLKLPSTELETMFKHGMLKWYIEYMTQYYRSIKSLETYDVHSRLQFYDFKRYWNLYIQAKDLIGFEIDVPIWMLDISIHQNYYTFCRFNGWRHISFDSYVKDNKFESYEKFISDLSKIESQYLDVKVKSAKSAKSAKSNSMYFDTISRDLHLLKLGIVFLRLKVIVEKLSKICETKDSESKLLILDRFATRIQEMIYLKIKFYVLGVQYSNLLYDEIDKIIQKNNNLILPCGVDGLKQDIEFFLS